jgi:hypothetical protein
MYVLGAVNPGTLLSKKVAERLGGIDEGTTSSILVKGFSILAVQELSITPPTFLTLMVILLPEGVHNMSTLSMNSFPL